MTYTVLVIDDHDIVRFGLESLVLACPELTLVGSAASLAEGLDAIEREKPQLVITDMAVGDSSGLETVRSVVAAQGERSTLVVSMQDEMLYGEQVLSLGAGGYVMKDTAHANAIPAALAVVRGDTWVSPRLQSHLANRLLKRHRPSEHAVKAAGLTLRELEVMELLKTGKTTKEIARAMDLSVRTVDLYRANVKRKLGLRTGAELIAFASNRL